MSHAFINSGFKFALLARDTSAIPIVKLFHSTLNRTLLEMNLEKVVLDNEAMLRQCGAPDGGIIIASKQHVGVIQMEPRRVGSCAASEARRSRHKMKRVRLHLQFCTSISNLTSNEASEVPLGRKKLRCSTRRELCKVADDTGKVRDILKSRMNLKNLGTGTKTDEKKFDAHGTTVVRDRNKASRISNRKNNRKNSSCLSKSGSNSSSMSPQFSEGPKSVRAYKVSETSSPKTKSENESRDLENGQSASIRIVTRKLEPNSVNLSERPDESCLIPKPLLGAPHVGVAEEIEKNSLENRRSFTSIFLNGYAVDVKFHVAAKNNQILAIL